MEMKILQNKFSEKKGDESEGWTLKELPIVAFSPSIFPRFQLTKP